MHKIIYEMKIRIVTKDSKKKNFNWFTKNTNTRMGVRQQADRHFNADS